MNKNKLYVVEPRFKSLGDVEVFARRLMAEHGLEGWDFKFNRQKRAAGICRPSQRIINLSALYAERFLDKLNDSIEDTLLHEVAHALNYLAGTDDNHGVQWKKWCGRLGCVAHRAVQPHRYRLIFGVDEVVGEFHRLPCWASHLRLVMLAGREMTLGELRFEVYDDGHYVAADEASLSVDVSGVSVEEMLFCMPHDEHVLDTSVVLPLDWMPELKEGLLAGFRHGRFYSFRERFGYFATQCFEGGVSAVPNLAMKWLDSMGVAADNVRIARLSGCVVGVERVEALLFLAMRSAEELVEAREVGCMTMTMRRASRVVAGCLIYNCRQGMVIELFDKTKRVPAFAGSRQITTNADLLQDVVGAVGDFLDRRAAGKGDAADCEMEKLNVLQSAADYLNEEAEFKLKEFVERVVPDGGELADGLRGFIAGTMEDEGRGFRIPRGEKDKIIKRMRGRIKLGNGFEILVKGAPHGCIRRGFDEASGMRSCEIFYKEK